ncbi:MAG: hypothetical protein FJX52_14405, partial [Alphaproteobacteria bacterium]|nr:hypothetical protein [Alphaproteobacteria bacterium]
MPLALSRPPRARSDMTAVGALFVEKVLALDAASGRVVARVGEAGATVAREIAELERGGETARRSLGEYA